MWSAGGDTLDVYLGTRCTGWSCAEGTEWITTASPADGLAAALGSVVPRTRLRRPRVRCWLSGALARPFRLEAVAGLASLDEAVRLASRLAPDLSGLVGPCVVRLDDWAPSHPCLAVAMARALREAVEGVAAACGWRLVGLRPWWSGALNALLAMDHPPAWAGIDEPDAFTVFAGVADGFTQAACHAPRPDAAGVAAIVARSRLAQDEEAASAVRACLLGEQDAGDDARHDASRLDVPFGARWERLA